jgi:hypothetical protein
VNVDPEPSLLHTDMPPRWLVTMFFTIANPNPVPPVARERAGSTR